MPPRRIGDFFRRIVVGIGNKDIATLFDGHAWRVLSRPKGYGSAVVRTEFS
jgi:hypothetical protein